MRTTNEIMEAARMGEPCTEEELRLCIVSMRSWVILAHSWHLRLGGDSSLPARVGAIAKEKWRQINIGWNIPVDERVSPDDRPGNPDLYRRRDLASKVFNVAQQSSVPARVKALMMKTDERQFRRFSFCPDHRDKPTGRCPLCEIEQLRAALEDCEEYFTGKEDADHNGVSYVPNEEMRLLTEIQTALGTLGIGVAATSPGRDSDQSAEKPETAK